MKVYATPEQINALMGARADRYDPRVYCQFIYLDVKAKRLVATDGHVMAEVEPEIVDAGTTTDAYFIVTGKIPKSWEVVELDFDSNAVTRKGSGTDTRKPIAIVRMPADQEPRTPIDWQRVSAHGAGFVEAIKNKGPASIGIDMSLVTRSRPPSPSTTSRRRC